MESGSYKFPDDRAYDGVHHMWALLDAAANRVTVGIDTLGLASLGELAYISLHEEGTRVERGESIGTLEAAKMTGDFLAPISGVLVARNEEALRNPYSVNEDPYEGGWLVAIAPGNWEQDVAGLVTGGDISPWVETEIQRYRAEGWID